MAKILVVDDDRLNFTILSTLLKGQHQLLHAANGKEGVLQTKIFIPDLILLDVMMPVMDGFTAAPLLKKASQAEIYLPIIFITGMDKQSDLIRCLEVGGDDFLAKPYDNVLLTAKINAHIRIRELSLRVKQQKDELTYHQHLMQREHEIVEHIFDNALETKINIPDAIQYYTAPASTFSGDIFLAAPSPHNSYYIFLGDFTGHGLAAAIGVLPITRIFHSMTSKGFTVGDIVSEMNLQLYQLLPSYMFCAAIMLEIGYDNLCSIWNGGMADILIIDNKPKQVQALVAQHMALGITAMDEFDANTLSINLKETQKLFIYSDGLVECQNTQGELFGEKRLEQLFINEPNQTLNRLMEKINIYQKDTEQDDDMTCALISHLGEQQAPALTFGVRGKIPFQLKLELQPSHIKCTDPVNHLLSVLTDDPAFHNHRSNLFLILTELYNNAVEHGLLGLDSNLKHENNGFSEYYQQRQQKLNQLNQGQITIELTFSTDKQLVMLTVIDTGKGFDHHKKLLALETSEEALHGRGIWLLKELVAEIKYSDSGRRVDITYQL